MDVARQKACRAAGAVDSGGRPKVLHDLRRTAIRQMTRAGVPRHVIMAIVGLKSEAVYWRYSILETEDLGDGLAQTAAYAERLPTQNPHKAPLEAPARVS